MAIDLEIKDNHLHFDGINLFRGNANNVQLGSVGGKKRPSTQENYLQVEANIPVKKLKVNKVTVITLNGARISGADVNASVDVPKLGTLSASAVATKLKEETLKLVKIDVLPRDVVDAANDSPKVLDALIQSGSDGRIAHQVITVMEAATAETVNRGGSTEIATVQISSGATFAYLLLKPKWDANQQKELEEDRGLGRRPMEPVLVGRA